MELPPFSLSRLANLTHAVAARLSLSIPSWQHVYRRLLRELDIEIEPSRRWMRQFLQSLQLSWKLAATCTRYRPSEADIAARERKLFAAARHLLVRSLRNLKGSQRMSGKFVQILCFVGRLSLNSLSVRAITVRVEPDLRVCLSARRHRHDYDLMWFGSHSTLRHCGLRSCWRQLVS